MTLRRDLESIDRWVQKNAPVTADAFRPGVTNDQEFASLEFTFDRELGVDVVTLLKWHDGTLPIVDSFQIWPGFTLLGTVDISLEWIGRNEVKLESQAVDWQRAWIPLGSNFGTALLVADQSRGKDNERMLISDIVEPARNLEGHVGPSLAEMIGLVTESLHHGSPLSGNVPVVRNGALAWRPA